MRLCEKCGAKATVYAMDLVYGGWGSDYCDAHIPTGFVIQDKYQS